VVAVVVYSFVVFSVTADYLASAYIDVSCETLLLNFMSFSQFSQILT